MLTTWSSLGEGQDVRRFCSSLAKSLGADPLGTAPMYDELLMVEFPLPWRRDVAQTPGFPEEVAAAVAEAKEAGRRLQLHAFAPDHRSREGRRRVMYFWRPTARRPSGSGTAEGGDAPDGRTAVGGFESVEYVVPAGDLSPLVRFLLFGEGGGGFDAGRLSRRGVRDLFVCTHGARDPCCGKFGAALHLELEGLLERGGGAGPEGRTRVWRVSHVGGHRFAPTVIDLPSGRYWGALRGSVLEALLHRDADLEKLRPYYRGWTGLRSPQEQVAEAEAWRRTGPEWPRRERWLWTVSAESEAELTTVAIQWRDPDTGAEGRFEADVAVDRVLELPESCGQDAVQSKQWLVLRFDEV